MSLPPNNEWSESTVIGYAVPVAVPPPNPAPRNHGTSTTDPPTVLLVRDSLRELLPGTIVNETYEVDARLGAGAMGEVYAARHIKLGKRVAIKVIGRDLFQDDDAIARFALEARTLAQIQHPAIVTVEHVGELSDGRAYFVMEYLHGEPLFERLQRGRIPLLGALHVLDQVARGLEAAHAHGIVHRDLKPENTFLVYLPGEPPTVKLLDFGLSMFTTERENLDCRIERAQNTSVGTPMYMSPEQMRALNVDHRTDIYALGCLAYELVLGVRPFPRARTVTELYAAHLHEAPPLPRSIWLEVPPQLDLVLFAMLAKEPAHRPTLIQIRKVIADVAATLSGSVTTLIVEPRSGRRSKRVWSVVLATLALAGGIVIGTLLPILESRNPPVPAVQEIKQLSPATPSINKPAATSSINTPTATPTPSLRTSSQIRPSTKSSAVRMPPEHSNSAPPPPLLEVDAGIDAKHTPSKAHPSPITLDRNQTINPFKRKVTP